MSFEDRRLRKRTRGRIGAAVRTFLGDVADKVEDRIIDARSARQDDPDEPFDDTDRREAAEALIREIAHILREEEGIEWPPPYLVL